MHTHGQEKHSLKLLPMLFGECFQRYEVCLAYDPGPLVPWYMVSYEQWCSELWLLGTIISKEKAKKAKNW